MNLITSTSKLGNDVARQKFLITACYIYVGILYAEQTVEHFLKSGYQLHFVKKDIVQVVVYHLGFDVSVESKWLPKF